MQTLYDILISIIGRYAPIYNVGETVTQTITDVSGNDLVSTVTTYYQSSIDWGYIASAVLFIVAIWSIFRLIGVLLSALIGGVR